jgi:flagellar protein FliO/FliZ
MKFFRPFTSVTRWLLVVIGCVVLATAQPMSAADEKASADAKATPIPLSGDTIIYPKGAEKSGEPTVTRKDDSGRGYILVLAVLMAGAGAWVLFQRRKGGLAAISRGTRKLQIEETRNLGNRQYLVVAEYEGQKFLLGVAPGQIQMLSALKNQTGEESA